MRYLILLILGLTSALALAQTDWPINNGKGSGVELAAPTVTGAASFTGNPTFSGTPSFTGTPDFSNGIQIGASGDTIDEYEEGTFTVLWNSADWSVEPGTVTVEYVRIGKMVTLYIPDFSGTSDSVSMSIGGLPNSIETLRSPTPFSQSVLVTNNGSNIRGCIGNSTSGSFNISFKQGDLCSNFTASGTKGLPLGIFYTYKIQ